MVVGLDTTQNKMGPVATPAFLPVLRCNSSTQSDPFVEQSQTI